jgi:hypothetical protein
MRSEGLFAFLTLVATSSPSNGFAVRGKRAGVFYFDLTGASPPISRFWKGPAWLGLNWKLWL